MSHHEPVSNIDYNAIVPLPIGLQRLRQLGLVVAVVAAVITLPGILASPEAFYTGYLFGFWFWLAISLGSLGVLMMHTLTSGNWGRPIRRHLEASARVVPVMALLAIPIVVGRYWLFPWAHPELVAQNPILQKQAPYMNTHLLVIRLAIYFSIWTLLAVRMSRLGLLYDKTGDASVVSRMKKTAGPGEVILAVTITLCAVDLLMARDAGWFSTMYGFIICGGMLLSAIIFSLVMLWALSTVPGIRHLITPDVLIDLGNLFLAFTVFWFYVCFGQFLVIWMGDEKIDTFWFTNRGLGQVWNPWCLLAISLALLNFLTPFLLLLQRAVKRNIATLGALAACALFLRLTDAYWLIKPSGINATLASYNTHFSIGALLRALWLDLPMPLGIGGIWMFFYLSFLGSRPLVGRAIDESMTNYAGATGSIEDVVHGDTSARPLA
jgi:hypothetical protein